MDDCRNLNKVSAIEKPGFYIENGGCMLDELLDKTIYQCTM